MLVLRALLIPVLLNVLSLFCVAQSCDDIQKVDFRNMRIVVAGERADQNELTTLYNAPLGKVHFNMRHGIAHHWDGGDVEDPGFLDYVDKDHPPDWEAKIVQDKLANPSGFLAVRFIEIFDLHLTGTGAWFYVLGFTCDAGKLKRMFQFTSMYASLKSLKDDSFTIKQHVWQRDDPEAGPSAMRWLHYQWLPEKGRYERVRGLCRLFNGEKYKIIRPYTKCK
jgi:hypothetical protein